MQAGMAYRAVHRRSAPGVWWWRAAALAWMLLMFWLSSRSDLPDPAQLPEWIPVDKVAHLFLFAVLAALLYLAGLRAPLAVLGAGLYGLSDEFHQMHVPGRSPELQDWMADVVGAVVGVWLVHRLRRLATSTPPEPVE
ncbi:MAG: VanZ family protein [Trueperaceae bacterium]